MKEMFGIEYSCYSPLSDDDETKYITEINGSILAYDENDVFIEVAGKFKVYSINLSQAYIDGYHVPSIFDLEEVIMDIGESMYDFENNCFLDPIKEGFNTGSYGDNLLVLDFIEVIAKYRKRNLCAMAIKDVINRFYNYSAFFALRIFTMQHVDLHLDNEEDKKWAEALKLNEFEQDQEQAFYKLAAFFHNLGFENIEDQIFAINLAKINPFDRIKLQTFD
jgi:hypothetical protein